MLPILGAFASSILPIINKIIPDQDKAKEIALQLEQEHTKQAKLQQEIILKEMNTPNGRWRPRLMNICMWVFVADVLMHVVAPWAIITFGLPYKPVSWPKAIMENVYLFMGTGIVGYVGARSYEKSKGIR